MHSCVWSDTGKGPNCQFVEIPKGFKAAVPPVNPYRNLLSVDFQPLLKVLTASWFTSFLGFHAVCTHQLQLHTQTQAQNLHPFKLVKRLLLWIRNCPEQWVIQARKRQTTTEVYQPWNPCIHPDTARENQNCYVHVTLIARRHNYNDWVIGWRVST